MLTRSMSPHVANDGIVDAATTRCMHREKTRETGMRWIWVHQLQGKKVAIPNYTGRGLVLRFRCAKTVRRYPGRLGRRKKSKRIKRNYSQSRMGRKNEQTETEPTAHLDPTAGGRASALAFVCDAAQSAHFFLDGPNHSCFHSISSPFFIFSFNSCILVHSFHIANPLPAHSSIVLS